MPTYVYECDSCEHRFEERQGFDDDPLTDCPRCEGSVRRVFHPAPIIFKGRGFYVTDSRPAGDGGVASTASGDSDASGAKETTAAESSEGGSGGGKEKTAATGEPPGD